MSSFGTLYKVTSFGESHGVAVGCVIEGVPAGTHISSEYICEWLSRRRPGKSGLSSSRNEEDMPEILSGTEKGVALGGPICVIVRNKDMKPSDYVMPAFRPGHADAAYFSKYNGCVASSGGGRSSARETVGRVIAGSIAARFLFERFGTRFVCAVSSIGRVHWDVKRILMEGNQSRIHDLVNEIEASRKSSILFCKQSGCVSMDRKTFFSVADGSMRESNNKPAPADGPLPLCICGNAECVLENLGDMGCPDERIACLMACEILRAKRDSDSVGGRLTCVVLNPPKNLGEPVFDKFHAELAKICMSIPSVKGFEIGSGFDCTELRGSEMNDRYVWSGRCAWSGVDEMRGGQGGSDSTNGSSFEAAGLKGLTDLSSPPTLSLVTNNCGGVNGGITNGEPVFFTVAFKAPSSIGQCQETAGKTPGESVSLAVPGRHDPCVCTRARVIVEACAAIATMDMYLRHNAVSGPGK